MIYHVVLSVIASKLHLTMRSDDLHLHSPVIYTGAREFIEVQ